MMLDVAIGNGTIHGTIEFEENNYFVLFLFQI